MYNLNQFFGLPHEIGANELRNRNEMEADNDAMQTRYMHEDNQDRNSAERGSGSSFRNRESELGPEAELKRGAHQGRGDRDSTKTAEGRADAEMPSSREGKALSLCVGDKYEANRALLDRIRVSSISRRDGRSTSLGAKGAVGAGYCISGDRERRLKQSVTPHGRGRGDIKIYMSKLNSRKF